MANRIYFANQQVAFRRDASTTWIGAHGVQAVAVTTTFNLEQAFELGQLAIYENIEGVPDIEMTMSKVLDGYPLLYHLATNEASETAIDCAASGWTMVYADNFSEDVTMIGNNKRWKATGGGK